LAGASAGAQRVEPEQSAVAAWEVVEGDLADLQSLERALEGCTGLFHAAADYRLGARDPTQLYRTNVEGTRRI